MTNSKEGTLLYFPDKITDYQEIAVPLGEEVAIIKVNGDKLRDNFRRECQNCGINTKTADYISGRLKFLLYFGDKPLDCEPAFIDISRKTNPDTKPDYQFQCGFNFPLISEICLRLTRGSSKEATEAAMRQIPCFCWEHERKHLLELAKCIEENGNLGPFFQKEERDHTLRMFRRLSPLAAAALSTVALNSNGTEQYVFIGLSMAALTTFWVTVVCSGQLSKEKIIRDKALNEDYRFQGQSYFQITFEKCQY